MNPIEDYNKKNNNKLPTIKGEKVILTPIPNSEEFYKLYHKWLKNSQIKYKIGEEDMNYTLKEVIEMHDEWKNDFNNITFCILNKKTKEPIGDINLIVSKEFNNEPEISIMLGEHAGKGFGYESSVLLIKFAFEKLKLKEINLTVYEDNLPAVNLYKKLGFQIINNIYDEDNRKEFVMKLNQIDFKKSKKQCAIHT